MKNLLPISELSDARLEPYRHLKDRDLSRETGGEFIAESEHVVRRLLLSDFEVRSLLLAQRRANEIAPLAREDTPVYVVPDAMIHQVVGYKFHSGVLACGQRKVPLALESVIPANPERFTLVVLPELANNENLGSMIRLASGLGANAMLLGPACCDPFYRLSIRVSTGTVFRLPIVRSTEWEADLKLLADRRIERVATVLDHSAEPLHGFVRAARTAIFFGNEAQGLSATDIAACDRRLTIPMRLGTDSLNVAVAAGIILHHMDLHASRGG